MSYIKNDAAWKQLFVKRKVLVLISLSLIVLLAILPPLIFGDKHQNSNPLLMPFDTPHQTPPFDQIKTEHFAPAIDAAIVEQRKEIESIVNNSAVPDFENTIVALERSGRQLQLIANILFNLNHAETNDELQTVASSISPLLADLSSEIILNKNLFNKVKHVYDNCDRTQLTVEQNTLLDETYKKFIKNGIYLNEAQKERYREITRQLSELSLIFQKKVLADTNNYYLHIDDPGDLSGLPKNIVEIGAENAKARGLDGWVYTLDNAEYSSIMKYAEKRELRAEMYKAYGSAGFRGNENDNSRLVQQIANLRLEMANILGHPTYAHYVLEDSMAETPVNVTDFQNKLLCAALPQAKSEVKDLQNFAEQNDLAGQIQPYDWSYYEQKFVTEKYNIREEELRPYFKLENVQKGIFGLAARLYGVKFVAGKKIPVYHPDVVAYEVFGEDNQFLGVLYLDFFPREGKSGGAWCTIFAAQEKYNGKDKRPQVSVVFNFTKPTATTPSLLSLDQVSIFLHEFGHALHWLLSDVTYSSLSGASVYRDFVELPSQIMEYWAFEEEFLNTFAVHYQTGEQIPQELVQKINEVHTFNGAYRLVSQLRLGMLDLAWHSISSPVDVPVQQFERQVLEQTNLLPVVEGTLTSTRFNHIFSGGYAAGYYSYNWSNVLATDAYQVFTAADFREYILSRGATEHPAILYQKFRGREASIDALLEKLNIVYDNFLPEGFVYLDEVIHNAEYDIRYYGENNFIGRQVNGYFAPRAILTEPAALALKKVQQELNEQGLGLKIFDGYRPQRAVEHFARWAADAGDTKMKKQYYPDFDKKDLFNLGYIASKSGHSRGSTVDLTVIKLDSKEELDMGSEFDFLGPISSHGSALITAEQAKNRNLLKDVMTKHGFIPYYKEWWHYTLNNEPYPQQYFDFPVS